MVQRDFGIAVCHDLSGQVVEQEEANEGLSARLEDTSDLANIVSNRLREHVREDGNQINEVETGV